MHQLCNIFHQDDVNGLRAHNVLTVFFLSNQYVLANWKWFKKPLFPIEYCLYYSMLWCTGLLLWFFNDHVYVETVFGLGQKSNKHNWEICLLLTMTLFKLNGLQNVNSQMAAMRVMLVMVQILYEIPMHNTTKCFRLLSFENIYLQSFVAFVFKISILVIFHFHTWTNLIWTCSTLVFAILSFQFQYLLDCYANV